MQQRQSSPKRRDSLIWRRPSAIRRWVWQIQRRFWGGLGQQANPIQALASVITLITVAWGAWSLVQGEGEWVKQSHYAAWQLVNSAQGQGASGGRIDALQDLNKDHVSLEGLSAPRANLSGIHLAYADLAEADLTGVTLVNADLTRADLFGANLSGADLFAANLNGARLPGANLSGANLYVANLSGAYLSEANLSKANLSKANLSKANLSGADLSGADLSGAHCSGAGLDTADLSGADFIQTDFRGAVLDPVQVKEAKHWEQAYYDEDFRQLLGLPPSILTPAP